MAGLPVAASGARTYRRRRAKRSLLYRTVQTHFETWLALRGGELNDADPVPDSVARELRRYLECGILAHGFARAHGAQCGHDFLIAFSCKGRGGCRRRVHGHAHRGRRLPSGHRSRSSRPPPSSKRKCVADSCASFGRRGLLAEGDAQAMAQWAHGGGFLSRQRGAHRGCLSAPGANGCSATLARPPFALERLASPHAYRRGKVPTDKFALRFVRPQ
jgi:hypothetical protein